MPFFSQDGALEPTRCAGKNAKVACTLGKNATFICQDRLRTTTMQIAYSERRYPQVSSIFKGATRSSASRVRKTPLFAPFIYKNDHFTKTGSGQT